MPFANSEVGRGGIWRAELRNPSFRTDVAGLRGVAVLLVVLYPARVPWLSGGYVGVDIFFVISGFLITGIIGRQITVGEFHPRRFLFRRIRRLLPASVVMIGATLLVASFFYGPHDLSSLAKSSVSAILYVSNFYFWRQRGYFASQVPDPPLLHTWSLSLEEQFYLVFTLAFFLCRRVAPRYWSIGLLAAAMVLFGVDAWMTARHPGAAFYLPLPRAWQFLLGSTVAVSLDKGTPQRWIREIVAGIGLAGILVSAIFITSTTTYPGFAALIPSLSAAGLIWANSHDRTEIGKLLSARVLLAIGAISYSLYLWHWPVLVLERYYFGGRSSVAATAVALACTFIFASVSFKYVEEPFRAGRAGSAPPLSLRPIGIAAVGVLLAAGATLMGAGLPGRPTASDHAQYHDNSEIEASAVSTCPHGAPEVVKESGVCEISPERPHAMRILLWGDSHANAIAPAMGELGREYGAGVWQASYSSCPPLLGVGVAHLSWSNLCRKFNKMVVKAIRNLRVSRVVMVAYWSRYLPLHAHNVLERFVDPYSGATDVSGGSEAANYLLFSGALRETVDTLKRMGIEVWVIRQVPDQGQYVPLLLSRTIALGGNPAAIGISLRAYRRGQIHIDSAFDALGNSVSIVDPAGALCSTGLCAAGDDRGSLYLDSNHLSLRGAELLKPVLRPIFGR